MPEASTVETPKQEKGVIDCGVYSGGHRIGSVPLEDISETLKQPDRFVWLGLYEPGADLLRQVQQEFRLHDLVIEDALHAHQRPKLEVYDESLFVVLRTAPETGSSPVEFGETHVFVGQNYVVTVRHGSVRSHVGLRLRC